jgi:hypothetical protein
VQLRWQPLLLQQLTQFTAMRSVRILYTALMVLLAKATDRELARMVGYLKEENRILRARLKLPISGRKQSSTLLISYLES